MEERRKYPRVSSAILVQFRSDSFEDFLSEYADNISLGGLFVRTDDPREIGALLYFQFLLRDGSRLIEGFGRVVRSLPPPGTDENPSGMGIEFVSLDAGSLAVIQDVIDQKQRKQAELDARLAGLTLPDEPTTGGAGGTGGAGAA